MANAFSPLVSLLTPVYNGEKFLAECIESVLAQTYPHWEYIIVNNCSTDRTLQIAQQYRQKDPRIRVVTNEQFVGVIENHHISFRQICEQAKYCKVVHADDWLFPEALSQMVQLAELNPSVGIIGSYRLDGTKVNLDGLPYPSPVVPGREICRKSLLTSLYVFGAPTALLVRSDLIRENKYYFDAAGFGMQADTAACYNALQYADFGFIHQVLSYTRRHQASQTSRVKRVNSYKIANMALLKKYGPVFLQPTEYEQRYKERLEDYRRFLLASAAAAAVPDDEFWDYHRKAVQQYGLPLSSWIWFRIALRKLSAGVQARIKTVAKRVLRVRS